MFKWSVDATRSHFPHRWLSHIPYHQFLKLVNLNRPYNREQCTPTRLDYRSGYAP